MAQLSLAQINEALAPFAEELAARMQWDDLIAEFRQKAETLQHQLSELDQQILRERADVDRLEQAGIYRFWKTLKGERDDALATEYLEWEAALGEREALAGQLAEIEERLQFLQARRAQLGDIDKPIEDLLSLKRKAFRKAVKNPLYQLESAITQFNISKLSLSSILVPLPGLLYDLNRLHRALQLNPAHIKKGRVFQIYGATFEAIEKRFESLIRSMDLYHKNADQRLPFHGGYFSHFVKQAQAVERPHLLAWVKKRLEEVKTLDTQTKVLLAQAEIEIKAAKKQHQKLLLNL